HAYERGGASRAEHAGRAPRLAGKEADAAHRRAPCRGSVTFLLGTARAIEPVPFFPRVQAIVRNATASVSNQPANRACQDLAGRTKAVGNGSWPRGRVQRNELVHQRFSQSHGRNTDWLPPERCLKRHARRRRDPASSTHAAGYPGMSMDGMLMTLAVYSHGQDPERTYGSCLNRLRSIAVPMAR